MGKSVNNNESLISDNDMASLSKLNLYNEAGSEVSFGSIYGSTRVIVVFIRHFFCGTCKAYVQELTKVRSEALEAAKTSIVLVGCGDWSLLAQYKEDTGFQGALFADPTRKAYDLLGMTSNLKLTPKGETKRAYIPQSVAASTLKSAIETIMSPWAAITGKNGSISQLGGEFVFGPGDKCSFGSKMQHTEDHMDVSDLMKATSVDFP